MPVNEMSPSCLTSPTSMNSCFYQSCDTGEDGMESDDTDARSNARFALYRSTWLVLSWNETDTYPNVILFQLRTTHRYGSVGI